MFLVFDGPDFSGKTKQIEKFSNRLADRHISHTVLKEPGSTSVGQQLRNIILHQKLDARAELALFFASRCQNLNENILVKKNTELVVCDRYIESTIAYQCYGNETVTLKQLKPMLEFFSYGVVPDLTIILDVDYFKVAERINSRGILNHYDDMDESYFSRVQSYYRSLKDTDTFEYIDTTNLSIDEVHDSVMKIYDNYMEKHPNK